MNNLENFLLAVLFMLVLVCVQMGCDIQQATKAAQSSSEQINSKAPKKLWESKVAGLPLGTYRFGGLYRVYYIDVDPFDQLKSNITIWCSYLAALAGLAIIAGVVLGYFNAQSHAFPFWKDIVIVAFIVFVGAFLLALIVQYMWWIIAGVVAGFAGYWGYVVWRKKKDEEIQKELIVTGELMKKQPVVRGKSEKHDIMTAQSDWTIDKVKQYKALAKKKAEEILATTAGATAK